MKHFYLFSCLFFFALSAKTQTIITGNITQNTTWAPSGSPYIVKTSSIISTGITLTILPGCVVKCELSGSQNMLQANGTVIANGTPTEPIVFTDIEDDTYGGDSNNDGSATSPTFGDWGGVKINASSSNASSFANCLFRFGGYLSAGVSPYGALQITGNNVTVNNCSFFKCEVGLAISSTGNVSVSSTAFTENEEVPIAVALYANPVFTDLTMTNNSMNGIGIMALAYTTAATYTLSKQNIAGIVNIPYATYGYNPVTLGQGVTLNIEPGVVVKHKGSSSTNMFEVSGTLMAQGTPTEPIIFTDVEDDTYGGDSNSDGSASVPTMGDWGGIRINTTSIGSTFFNCLFRFGGYTSINSNDASLEITGSSPTVKNITFSNCETALNYSGNVDQNISNCIFIDNKVAINNNGNNQSQPLQFDSCQFCSNKSGIKINQGSVNVSMCNFINNTIFDIENLSPSDVTAANNWWVYSVYDSILTFGNTKNYLKIYDKKDNPQKGNVLLSNPSPPSTNFIFDLSGNRAAFTNLTPDVKSFIWKFGDGVQSTKINPEHVFTTPNLYKVCLEPSDCDPNSKGSICKNVLIKGLTSLSPEKSGRTNTYIGFIKGAGFHPDDIVQLTKSGQSNIVADTIIFIDETLIKVFFTFNNIAIGKWDILVQGLFLNDILTNALTIEENKSIKFESFVESRNRILVNRPTKIRIGVKNLSNQTAFGVPVYISINSKFNPIVTNLISSDSIPQIDTLLKNGFMKLATGVSNDTLLIGVYLIPAIKPSEVRYIDLLLKASEIFNDTIKTTTSQPWLAVQDLIDGGVLYRDPPSVPSCIKCVLDVAGVFPVAGCPAAIIQAGIAAYETEEVNGVNYKAIGSVLNATKDIVLGCAGAGALGKIEKIANAINNGLGAISLASDCIECGRDIAKLFPVRATNSLDPNEKIGLSGATEENYIRTDNQIIYTIFFENADSATAPANEVFITDTLDASVFEISTVEFIGFNFGDSTFLFTYPIKDTSFVVDINLNPAKNAILRVKGVIDHLTGVIRWSFRTFDPITYDLTEDIDLGFLPPNVSSPEGEGYVKFSISPKADLPHLTQIKNSASIIFDYNLPIVTPVFTNTVDIIQPTSEVLQFTGPQTDTIFNVKWTGNDSNAGIAIFNLFYSINGSNYALWTQGNAALEETQFKGVVGNTYCFYTVAEDYAGNVEDIPTEPDACTSVIVGTNEQANDGYELYQNIPNPFTSETTIGFKLPELTSVKLIVHNQLGQSELLIDERLSNGYHQFLWSPKEGGDGVYFYTIITPKYTKTRKMVLKR